MGLLDRGINGIAWLCDLFRNLAAFAVYEGQFLQF